MNEVRIDFSSGLGSACAISSSSNLNENNVYKDMAKSNGFFFKARPFLYYFKYIELENTLMCMKISLNNNQSFYCFFALFRQWCRSAVMNEVRIDFFSGLGSTCTIRVYRIWKENNLNKNIAK